MISKVGLGFVVSILMLSSVAFAQGFQDVIGTLKDIGVFQFYLPFLLVFAILYGLLLKTKIFGEQNKGLVTVIALAAAGFIMVYTPVGITFSQFLANFFGNVVVVILTVIVIIIFTSMLKEGGFDIGTVLKGGWLWAALLLLLIVVFGVFVASGGTSIFPGLKIFPKETFGAIGGVSTTTWTIIILIAGTALIVWLFSKGGGVAGGGKPA